MPFEAVVVKWGVCEQPDVQSALLDFGNGEVPSTLIHFDVKAFLASIKSRFGDVNRNQPASFFYTISDYECALANWVSISIDREQASRVLSEIVSIAKSHGLAVIDRENDRWLGVRSGRSGATRLEVQDRIFEDPSHEEIDRLISSEEFAVLSVGDDPLSYLQFSRSSHKENRLTLEYQEGSLDAHFRAKTSLHTDDIKEAFHKYAMRDSSWGARFVWERINV